MAHGSAGGAVRAGLFADDVVAARPSVLAALIGRGIQASLTPALHEREGAAQGLRSVYKLVDTEVLGLGADSLPELIRSARALGFAGLNITHPFKQAVLQHLDDLAAPAAAIGAVNTIVFEEGRAVGHNTDVSGFAESFRRALADVPRRRVVLLGAGGAGAAVAAALFALGAEHVAIVDVEADRAERLAKALVARFGAGRASASTAAQAAPEADGLVNATPVGMAAYPGLPLARELVRPDLWVADVIYFPRETALLALARALGCRTMGGGGMAVFQAAGAFQLFTGRLPDVERMQEHFRLLTAGD